MEPLAILVGENVVLMSRAAESLRQMNYRVLDLRDPTALVATARDQRPLFVIVDLQARVGDVCAAIEELKRDPALKHVLVLAFGNPADDQASDSARRAGADMVTPTNAITHHFPRLIDQLLAL